jgi:hypothetical protein
MLKIDIAMLLHLIKFYVIISLNQGWIGMMGKKKIMRILKSTKYIEKNILTNPQNSRET